MSLSEQTALQADSDSPAPDRFLRDTEVIRMTGVSRSRRYEMIARGEFPKPVRIGPQAIAWSEREIAEWMRQRIAERDAETADGGDDA